MFILSGCGPSAEEKERKKLGLPPIETVPRDMVHLNESDVTVYEFRGCSYIVGHTLHMSSHMGNCPNPIHKYVKTDSIQ